jgi:type I restriction enzyme R subunit
VRWLDQGVFADKGGFTRISQEFDGALDDVLHAFNEAIWGTPAA